MRTESGMSLVELSAAVLVLAAGAAALGTVTLGAIRTDRAAAEQAADAAAAAAALDSLQRDLRRVTDFEKVEEGFLRARAGEEWISWRLAGGRILRNAGGRDLALGRNLAGFSVEVRGRLATVRIRAAEREGGLVPAWSAAAAAATRIEEGGR